MLRLSFRDGETAPADKRYCRKRHLESEASLPQSKRVFMSQRGIRIKLLISDGKITIPRTKHPFEFATKNFVKTTKNPVYELHEQSRFTGNHTNTTRCGRRQAAIKRKTDAVEHRCWNTPEKGGGMQDTKYLFPHFSGGGEIRPSAGRTSPQGTGGDRPSSARKALPGSRRSPCPAGKLRRPLQGGVRQARQNH